MTSFNWRFVAAMQELHARVDEGALGRVFHVSGRWVGGRWAKETDAADLAHGPRPGRPRLDG